jgi:hypothetical protein
MSMANLAALGLVRHCRDGNASVSCCELELAWRRLDRLLGRFGEDTLVAALGAANYPGGLR